MENSNNKLAICSSNVRCSAWRMCRAIGRAKTKQNTMSTKAIMLLEGQDTTYPQAADLYRLRGELLMRVGDKAGAEADMQKSVSVEPVRPAR